MTIIISEPKETIHFDSEENLDDAIDRFTEYGWECDPSELIAKPIMFHDLDSNQLVAIIAYKAVPGEEYPHLVVHRILDGTLLTYRRVDDSKVGYVPLLVGPQLNLV